MSSLVAVASSSGAASSLLLYALPVLLVAFIFITQRRRAKDAQRVQAALGVGDQVTTTSGLLGRITALGTKIATLEVSPGVTVQFDRRAIAGPAPTESPSSDVDSEGLSGPTSINDTDVP
jgi:preprotein translocase subunit YajC